ncbi:MAG: hypothetical protein SPL70_06165, partial [Cyanobacteriota bacterium]|nr:hypothetical protein [Cyanobacteriota bacterium]
GFIIHIRHGQTDWCSNVGWVTNHKLASVQRDVISFHLLIDVVLGTVLVACGAIVNAANNHQRATSANNATTDKGNEYTKVNMGKKLGAILGAVAAVGIMAANKAIMKPFNKIQKENLKNLEEFAGKDIAKLLKKSGHLAMALTVAANAVGGLALGAIADKISNHKAAKAADKAVA